MERERTRQALFEYEYSVLNAFREVQDGLIEMETLKEELEARNERVLAAESARGLSELRYNKGVTSYLEVIETQRQEFEAKLAYSENYNKVLVSYIKFYKVLGGGWITPEERNTYAQQKARQENSNANSIEKETLIYEGQIIELNLTQEQIQARKDKMKEERRLEKEQRKKDNSNM